LIAALEVRDRTGSGQLVEVPLVDGALNIAAEQVLEWQRTGEVLTRHGNRGPWAHPQGIYPSRGEDASRGEAAWLALAVETEAQWRGLVSVVGPSLADRTAPADDIDAAIAAWCAGCEADAAAAALGAAGVPASPVAPTGSAHDNPQFAHRGFLQPLTHPVTGSSGYPGFPMRCSAFGPHLFRSPPPLLGQHNDEVLTELGLSGAEIADLAARGVIGDRPQWEG